MIEFKRGTYRLNKLITPYTEYGNSSVFQLSMPETLGLGKNEIKLKVKSEALFNGSDVLIDILDSNNEPIYFKVSRIANADQTRTIVVYIHDTTPIGKGTLYVSGMTKSQSIYLFSTNIIIGSDTTKSSIKFLNEPIIEYAERQEPVKKITTINRLINVYNISGSVSIISKPEPKQLSLNSLDLEKSQLTTKIQNIAILDNIGTAKSIDVPKYFDKSVLTAKNFTFSSSMNGGMIYVNNISLPVPGNSITTSPFQNHSYSASILNVINTSSIEVFPGFLKTVDYTTDAGTPSSATYNRFFNHTNFTSSYYNVVNFSSSATTQSYVMLDLYNLSPEVGNVDSIKVSYKSKNKLNSSYQPLGVFNIDSINLLTDSSSIYFTNESGYVERPIGIFNNGLSDFQNFWASQSIGTGSILVSNSTQVSDGIKITYPSTRSLVDFTAIRPKNQYNPFVCKNTELLLTIDTFSEVDQIDVVPQLDVYISGSTIRPATGMNPSTLLPYNTSSFGKYVGSIDQSYGKLTSNIFEFVNDFDGNIQPVFVIRAGTWHFGNITLKPAAALGFNPNQSRVFVLMENDSLGTEVQLKIEYLNKNSEASEFYSILDNLYFSGPGYENVTFKQINLSQGSASFHIYHDSRITSASTSPGIIRAAYPLFVDQYGNSYTGSNYSVGMNFTSTILVYGTSGDINNPVDTYIWSSVCQGRASINPIDNAGHPFIYNIITISGSSLFTLGTFGPGGSTTPSKPNLDSWLSFNSIGISNNLIQINYRLTTTSSIWNLYTSATCEVHKYEHKF